MQHIDLVRESEFGAVLERFARGGIDLRVVTLAPPDSAFLRFIDPYGNTVFNQLQLPGLIGELEALAAGHADDTFRQNVAALVEFLRKSVDIHTYVRFIGD